MQRGYSPAAGRNALMKCSLARVLWNIPLMILPPMIMARLSKTKLLATNPKLKGLTEIGIITGMVRLPSCFWGVGCAMGNQ